LIGYSYHPDAIAEVIEAVREYEGYAPGLGRSFREKLDSAVDLLRQFPGSAAPLRGTLRRKPLQRFPYAVIYAVEDSEIRIYAVPHRRRRPEYWIDRIPSR
jgi:plasmid stabilization system protein ParE